MTVVLDKLELLRGTFSNEAELDRVLDKLLDNALGQYRLRVARYEQDLHKFEQRYGMDSAVAYQRFEAGELGDAMDFFEWTGLYELHQDLLDRIHRMCSIIREKP